jgi:uncharacterized protein (TIGR02246 family)
MTRLLATGALLTASLLSAGPAMAKVKPNGPVCASVTAAAVEAQFARFNDAFETKDPETVTRLFSDDAVLLATVSNVPRTDHAAIKDYFVSFLKSAPVGTINSSTVKLGCNLAYRMGTWTVALTNQNSGVRNNVKARYTFIYKYDAGQWKIAHLHSSMMPIPE